VDPIRTWLMSVDPIRTRTCESGSYKDMRGYACGSYKNMRTYESGSYKDMRT
jgi:hypothetical protein